MDPSTRTTVMDALLLAAAGLFTLLTGIVEAVRIFAGVRLVRRSGTAMFS